MKELANEEKLQIIQKDAQDVLSSRYEQLEALKGECVLIAGGTGFVGTWLIELISFLNDNYNFNTRIVVLARRESSFKSRTPHLAEKAYLDFIECDIRNLKEIPSDVTMVINAAGNPDSRAHSSDPLNVMAVIANGTEALLSEVTRLPNLKRFLQVSSGLIYGSQPCDSVGISEHSTGGPDCNSISSVYAESKRFSETLCSAYRSLFKIPIVVARPFAFIGPYQLLDKPWAINNFIRECLMNEPIRILGDGQTVRSYMYASDMAFWLLRMLVAGKVGLAYNVGSPKGVSLQELAKKIVGNFSANSQILSGCATSERVSSSKFVPDVNLACDNLGLELTVDIDEAIRRTLLWFGKSAVKYV